MSNDTAKTTGNRTNLALGRIGKNSTFKKIPAFTLKRPSFSGANWKSKFIRVSRDLWILILTKYEDDLKPNICSKNDQIMSTI
jgi:hypothetical protein